MTILRFPRQSEFVAVLALFVAGTAGLAQVPAQANDQQIRIELKEIGLLRTLVMLDSATSDLENRVTQQLTDKDYRVFPNATMVGARVTPEEMRAAGEKANADLVVFAMATDRVKNKKDDWLLYEGEATVQVYSRVSGELLVSKTVTVDGRRTTDGVEARRSARRKAIDDATREAIEGSQAKAHRIMVYEAVIVNVFSDNALLAQMEWINKMAGIKTVRRLSFNRQTNEALVEILGEPQSEITWRAWMEKMPKTKVNVQLTANDTIHNKYPSWFLQPAQN